MSIYYHLQEFNDLLWATPVPIIVMINSQMAKLRLKGNCAVIVIEPNKLQEQAPDSKALLSQVRSTLVSAATDMVINTSRKVSKVSELSTMKIELANSLQSQVVSRFEELGLRINRLEIQSIEEV